MIDITEINKTIDNKVKELNKNGYEIEKYLTCGGKFNIPRVCESCGKQMHITEGDIILYTTNCSGKRKFRCLECAKRLNIV